MRRRQISNPDAAARPSEVVDLPLAEVIERLHVTAETPIAAHLHGVSQDLPTQRYASIVDGKPDRLLVLVDLAPHQELKLDLEKVATTPEFKSLVHARKVPERKDDFAWENNVVAFRVYGPALQATGEITSGIDIWSKRVPDFITESFYHRDLEGVRTHNPALSYHKDNGQGLDSYEVGTSRGCGGTAVFLDGKLIPSQNAIASRILADGPIRVDFILDYGSWQAAGGTIHEMKRITLDAGSKLNRMRSTFTFDGALTTGPTLTVAAGIAMHTDAVLRQPSAAIASVWDTPQLATAGRIGTALVIPAAEKPKFVSLPMEGKVAGHALFLFDIHSGDTIDYYAGTVWSQADTPNQENFDAYLKDAEMRIDHPAYFHWQKK